jgi:hypothetical protein
MGFHGRHCRYIHQLSGVGSGDKVRHYPGLVHDDDRFVAALSWDADDADDAGVQCAEVYGVRGRQRLDRGSTVDPCQISIEVVYTAAIYSIEVSPAAGCTGACRRPPRPAAL